MINNARLRRQTPFLILFWMLLDFFLVELGAIAAHLVRYGNIAFETHYLYTLVIAGPLYVIIARLMGLYNSWRGRWLATQLWRVTLVWVMVVIIMVVMAFLFKVGASYSRIWASYWFIITWGMLSFARMGFLVLFDFARKQGWNHKQILIIGAGNLGLEIVERLRSSSWTGYDAVAFLDDSTELENTMLSGLPVVKPEAGLDKWLFDAEVPVDEVWIAMPLHAEVRIQSLFQAIRHSSATIRMMPNLFGSQLLNHSSIEIAGLQLVNLSPAPMKGFNRVVKAIEDRVLASLFLLAVSPLMLVIAVGVKLSSKGPVLYKQQRQGWDGKPFIIYKFRTMVVHETVDGELIQAQRIDPRITLFGSLLRRTSLDELPQLINVLQGHMSVVGPRPHAMAHHEYYKQRVDAYMQRHKVKPGITGWAQVKGWRGETDILEKMERRVACDLDYIDNWSFFLDIKIIFITLFKSLMGRQAY